MIGETDQMKKSIICLVLVSVLLSLLVGCGGNKEEEITCTMCNGSGEVKYYFGDKTILFTFGIMVSIMSAVEL